MRDYCQKRTIEKLERQIGLPRAQEASTFGGVPPIEARYVCQQNAAVNITGFPKFEANIALKIRNTTRTSTRYEVQKCGVQ